MEITVKDKDTCVKDVDITVTRDEVEKEYKALYDEHKHDISIPGFRKGKFPRKLFERKYADTIAEDVRNRIRENYLQEALEEKGFAPLVAPEIDAKEFKRDEAYEFTATVELAPDIELPDLGSITLEKDEEEVTDEMIDNELSLLRERMKSYKAKQGTTVEEGDKIYCDYEISVDGEVIESQEDANMFAEENGSFLGDVKDYPEAVMGKNQGESVTLKTVLPPYFHKKEYQGKEASVTVDIKKMESKVLPDPDTEEFYSAFGMKSLDDLKEKISERIEGEIRNRKKAKYAQGIYTYFDENTDIGLPPTVLKREIERRRNRLKQQLSQQDIKDDELKKKIEEAEEDIQQEAEKALKNYFILERIAEENKIIVTEEEIDRRVASLAVAQRVTPADMKEHLARIDGLSSLKSDIREDKTIEFIIDKANITSAETKTKKKSAKKSSSGRKKSAKKSSSGSKAKTKKGTKEKK